MSQNDDDDNDKHFANQFTLEQVSAKVVVVLVVGGSKAPALFEPAGQQRRTNDLPRYPEGCREWIGPGVYPDGCPFQS